MHVNLTRAVVLLTLLLLEATALGSGLIVRVRPSSPTQGGLSFVLKSSPSPKGTNFAATITGPETTTSSYSASLGIVTQAEGSDSIEELREIPLTQARNIYRAAFEVSGKTLKRKGLCFIFREQIRTTRNGKLVMMPSANFYTLPLKDFIE